jgi:glycosyltransferase involved in cell wall biosynthesis
LVDLFLERVRPEHPAASLIIVGPPGPELPGVTYHTGITDYTLAAFYRRAWVYASPSIYEGFGLPYLEAMACGTPVVATPNPGSIEVLGDGQYGLLAKDEDFADAVLSLLRDDSARQAMSVRGIQRAREHSLTIMLNRYEELLFELLSVHAKSMVSI